MITQYCRVCGNTLAKMMQFENMASGAQFFLTKDTLSTDKGISLPICQCAGCGLVQIPLEPVSYYNKAIRSPAWLRSNWRKKQLSDITNEFNLKGKKIVTINEEPKPDSYDAFFMFNYLEHFPDPVKTLMQLRDNLSHDGIGVIEVPNFDMIAIEGVFSELVIDHLFYFTKNTLTLTLLSAGFDVIKTECLLDGYILSAIVRKKLPPQFVNKFKEVQQKLTTDIDNFISKYSSVALWGAGHQTFFLTSTMKNLNNVSYVIDSSKNKQDKYIPVSHLPIVAPEFLKTNPVEAIIVLVGGFYYEIPVQIKSLGLDYSIDLAVVKKTEIEML